MANLAILNAMEREDPDGWTHREPTEADYEEFRSRMIRTYGERAWSDYSRGGWAENGSDWL